MLLRFRRAAMFERIRVIGSFPFVERGFS